MIEKLAVSRGVFYEGDRNDLRVVHPTPVVSRATCDFIAPNGGMHVLFREDSFDPVTRIRRGRLYTGGPLGDRWYFGRVDHGVYHPYQHYGPQPAGGVEWTPEASYDSWIPTISRREILGNVIELGVRDFINAWRIVGVELIAIGHILLTLRSISLIGAIPELATTIANKDGSMVNPKLVHEALDALVDALHKQQATPIVDVARETARVILTAWIGSGARGKDLGDVIKLIPVHMSMATWAASITNRLHPRGKSSEREDKAAEGISLRPVVHEDAEASVELVGLLLREIGWAAA